MGLAVNTPSINNRNSPVSSTDAIKVMVVDDSAVVRGLVSRWVGEESGMEIVARHANGQKAVDDIAASQPDIIILDVEMPVMDGIEALPQLLREKPAWRQGHYGLDLDPAQCRDQHEGPVARGNRLYSKTGQQFRDYHLIEFSHATLSPGSDLWVAREEHQAAA